MAPGRDWCLDRAPHHQRRLDRHWRGAPTGGPASRCGARGPRRGAVGRRKPRQRRRPASGPRGRILAPAHEPEPCHPAHRRGRRDHRLGSRRASRYCPDLPARDPRRPAGPRITSSRHPRRPREGTKQAAVLALLRRPEGATVAQVVEATGWAPHTVRGFFAGLRTRHGIEVTVLERVRQVGPNNTGAKGSYSVYQIAAVTA
ncbi:DUF3489 domain-containing protein [Falsiroseomonas sp. E2-1-a20]|uniref:DUF3489 domain-containing protein n=1 Tax=Falsiroseomonas sp. E2-1-a20 TaxID=3239300 RepID=UPI003F34861A